MKKVLEAFNDVNEICENASIRAGEAAEWAKKATSGLEDPETTIEDFILYASKADIAARAVAVAQKKIEGFDFPKATLAPEFAVTLAAKKRLATVKEFAAAAKASADIANKAALLQASN